MQNDMKNLLDNTNIGTVFLDEHLVIRRFTREAAQVYRLVASDVGRPLSDIKSNLEGEDLLTEAQAVLDSLVPSSGRCAPHDGAWYLARIQPYRTLDNVIEGVVLTFTDISKRIEAEAAGKAARTWPRASSIPSANRCWCWIASCRWSPPIVRSTVSSTLAPEDTVGRQIYELGNRQWNIPALRELLEDVLLRGDQFRGLRSGA